MVKTAGGCGSTGQQALTGWPLSYSSFGWLLVNKYLLFPVNPDKQHKKLRKLDCRAQECLIREEAQKILRKADKAHRKLSQGLKRI